MTAVTRPTLSEIKTQCRIDHDYDDDYLSQLENSAFNLMNTYSFYNDRSAEKIPGAAMFILNQFRIAQA